MKTFNEMNAVWDAWVSPGNTPARATVEAKARRAGIQCRDHGGGGEIIAATNANILTGGPERSRSIDATGIDADLPALQPSGDRAHAGRTPASSSMTAKAAASGSKPKPGDCCVFCSYGSVPCPPMQEGKSCGAGTPQP
jgi:hypothetical protein